MAKTREPAPPVVVAGLPAEIDTTNSAAVGQQLATAFAPGVQIVVADMTGTTFCDSTGVRALLAAHQHAAGRSAELRLAAPCAAVRQILALDGARPILAAYPTVAPPSPAPARRTPISPPPGSGNPARPAPVAEG